MPNYQNKLANQRIKLGAIVERLPMYRFLTESHATLLKLEPFWQRWLHENLPNLNFSAAHLSTFDTRTQAMVTIYADNATTAALLKHKKDSILKALNTPNLVQIDTIKVRIDPATAAKLAKHHRQLTEPDSPTEPYEAPDQRAINAITSLQQRIKNPDLADTLGNLAETLKNLSK